MTDIPVLFKPEMVRPILREIKEPGTGKTQTRRILKPQPDEGAPIAEAHLVDDEWCWLNGFDGSIWSLVEGVKYSVGDRLWVREAWRPIEGYSNWDLLVRYAADGSEIHFGDGEYDSDWNWPKAAKKGDVPSIHQPKWVSRITCPITDVRVQRLQDITEEDARAEGIEKLRSGRGYYDPTTGKGAVHIGHYFLTARDAFQHLWDSINAKPKPKKIDAEIHHYESFPWGGDSRTEEYRGKPHIITTNPWIVAVTFKPILKNILIGETE